MRYFALLICCATLVFLVGCATPARPLVTGAAASTSAAEHNNEGIKHYQMGHWDVAEEHFQEAVKADPELAEPHYNLALALHQMGSHDEATAHFKKAAELAPNNPAITQSGVYRHHVAPPSSYERGYY